MIQSGSPTENQTVGERNLVCTSVTDSVDGNV